jgi:nucleoside diphosphate kinase
LSSKPFFGGLVEYIVSSPVVALVWEGKSAVATGRKLVGATNPLASEPGTIRGDFAIDLGRQDLLVEQFLCFPFVCLVLAACTHGKQNLLIGFCRG